MSSLSYVSRKLEARLVRQQFQGYDPHDALNSPLVKALTLGNRYMGIAALQLLKRSPINLRPVLGVRKGINPKGYGLLVATYVKKFLHSGNPADLARAEEFATWLIENPSPGCSGAAWGYNFDWPNRNAIFPAGTPTIVNTAYIAEALLDLYGVTQKGIYREAALSSAYFLFHDLNQSGVQADEICFSYTPLDRTQIHNANMLGAALLARLYALVGTPAGGNGPAGTGVSPADGNGSNDDVGRMPSPGAEHAERLKQAAISSMLFSLNRQQDDGSWLYGTEDRNSWIDSYHTGYNLLALKRYLAVFPAAERAVDALKNGYRFYLDNFFTDEGFVKYYHNATHPWDAHAMAHAILTLDELEYLFPEESRILRDKVLARTLDTFWDERRGCFIYLVTKHWKNRIDYIRWVQFWMFYALVNHQKVEGLKGSNG